MSNNDSLEMVLSGLDKDEIQQNSTMFLSLLESAAVKTDSRINNELLRKLIENYRSTAERLRESEHLYRSVIAAMEEGIVVHGKSGAIVTHNSSAERILGLSRDQLLGRTSTDPRWKAIRQDKTPFPGEEHPAMVTLRTGEPQHGIIMGVHTPEGSFSWLSVNSQPVMGAETHKPVAVVATFIDVTERLSREEELTRVSETDHLTQISNRLKFSSILAEEMKKSRRYGYALSLLMFDIDHFKKVNDTYGHDIGDIVLVETVNVVKQLIRESDLLVRWGGEEFIILLPHTDLSEAARLGERIRAAIEKKRYRDVGHITCSFGAVTRRDSETEDNFTKRVDEALYTAKKSGRNRVVAFDNTS